MASKYANPDISVSSVGYHLTGPEPACTLMVAAMGGSHCITSPSVSVREPQITREVFRQGSFKTSYSLLVDLTGFSNGER